VGGAVPTATQAAAIATNANATSNFTVYDSLGTPMNITIYWYQTADTQVGAQAQWSYVAYNTTGGAAPSGVAYPAPGSFLFCGGAFAPEVGTPAGADPAIATTMGGSVSFNNDGSLATNGTGTGNNATVTLPEEDGSMSAFTFSLNLGTPNTPANAAAVPPVVASWGKSNGLTGAYGDGKSVNGIYTPNQSIYTKAVDGYSKGTLTGVSFNTTGGIEATFTNGQTIVIAQLALTNFTNPGGLESNGGNYFTATDNSGSAQIGTAGSDGFGTIDGGALEQSNVSMSTELTNMILAQTMYQSSAKVISTQSSLFQDLFNAIPNQ
jgi:flagellar hook-basal body protein